MESKQNVGAVGSKIEQTQTLGDKVQTSSKAPQETGKKCWLEMDDSPIPSPVLENTIRKCSQIAWHHGIVVLDNMIFDNVFAKETDQPGAIADKIVKATIVEYDGRINSTFSLHQVYFNKGTNVEARQRMLSYNLFKHDCPCGNVAYSHLAKSAARFIFAFCFMLNYRKLKVGAFSDADPLDLAYRKAGEYLLEKKFEIGIKKNFYGQTGIVLTTVAKSPACRDRDIENNVIYNYYMSKVDAKFTSFKPEVCDVTALDHAEYVHKLPRVIKEVHSQRPFIPDLSLPTSSQEHHGLGFTPTEANYAMGLPKGCLKASVIIFIGAEPKIDDNVTVFVDIMDKEDNISDQLSIDDPNNFVPSKRKERDLRSDYELLSAAKAAEREAAQKGCLLPGQFKKEKEKSSGLLEEIQEKVDAFNEKEEERIPNSFPANEKTAPFLYYKNEEATRYPYFWGWNWYDRVKHCWNLVVGFFSSFIALFCLLGALFQMWILWALQLTPLGVFLTVIIGLLSCYSSMVGVFIALQSIIGTWFNLWTMSKSFTGIIKACSKVPDTFCCFVEWATRKWKLRPIRRMFLSFCNFVDRIFRIDWARKSYEWMEEHFGEQTTVLMLSFMIIWFVAGVVFPLAFKAYRKIRDWRNKEQNVIEPHAFEVSKLTSWVGVAADVVTNILGFGGIVEVKNLAALNAYFAAFNNVKAIIKQGSFPEIKDMMVTPFRSDFRNIDKMSEKDQTLLQALWKVYHSKNTVLCVFKETPEGRKAFTDGCEVTIPRNIEKLCATIGFTQDECALMNEHGFCVRPGNPIFIPPTGVPEELLLFALPYPEFENACDFGFVAPDSSNWNRFMQTLEIIGKTVSIFVLAYFAVVLFKKAYKKFVTKKNEGEEIMAKLDRLSEDQKVLFDAWKALTPEQRISAVQKTLKTPGPTKVKVNPLNEAVVYVSDPVKDTVKAGLLATATVVTASPVVTAIKNLLPETGLIVNEDKSHGGAYSDTPEFEIQRDALEEQRRIDREEYRKNSVEKEMQEAIAFLKDPSPQSRAKQGTLVLGGNIVPESTTSCYDDLEEVIPEIEPESLVKKNKPHEKHLKASATFNENIKTVKNVEKKMRVDGKTFVQKVEIHELPIDAKKFTPGVYLTVLDKEKKLRTVQVIESVRPNFVKVADLRDLQRPFEVHYNNIKEVHQVKPCAILTDAPIVPQVSSKVYGLYQDIEPISLIGHCFSTNNALVTAGHVISAAVHNEYYKKVERDTILICKVMHLRHPGVYRRIAFKVVFHNVDASGVSDIGVLIQVKYQGCETMVFESVNIAKNWDQKSTYHNVAWWYKDGTYNQTVGTSYGYQIRLSGVKGSSGTPIINCATGQVLGVYVGSVSGTNYNCFSPLSPWLETILSCLNGERKMSTIENILAGSIDPHATLFPWWETLNFGPKPQTDIPYIKDTNHVTVVGYMDNAIPLTKDLWKETCESEFHEYCEKNKLDLHTKFKDAFKITNQTHQAAINGFLKYDRSDQCNIDTSLFDVVMEDLFEWFLPLRNRSKILNWHELIYRKESISGWVMSKVFKNITKGEMWQQMGYIQTFWDTAHLTNYPWLFSTCAKVENLPYQKVLAQNLRGFIVEPGEAFVFDARMNQHMNHLMCHEDFFKNQPIKHGIKLFEGGYDTLIRDFESVQNVIFGSGDCKKWDSSLKTWVMKVIVAIRYYCWDKQGMSSAEWFSRQNYINEQNWFSYVVLPNGQVMQKFTGGNSGRVNTTDDNCIIHAFIWCYLFRKIFKKPIFGFMENRQFSLALYADDHVFSVDRSLNIHQFDVRLKIYQECGIDLDPVKDLITDSMAGQIFLGHQFIRKNGRFYPTFDVAKVYNALSKSEKYLPPETVYNRAMSFGYLTAFQDDVFDVICDFLSFIRNKYPMYAFPIFSRRKAQTLWLETL
jgi:hypothetical protein